MKKYQKFSSENFQFLVVKFSVYLNRHVFVMHRAIKEESIALRHDLAKN